MPQETLTIGQLAKAAGVNVETVRYYQRIKLMPIPKRSPGSRRQYGENELQRLRFVKTAQGLGFSLDEVAELMKLDDGTRCGEAMRIASHKLSGVRERLRHLRRIEKVLTRLVRSCEAGRGSVRCPLIAALKNGKE